MPLPQVAVFFYDVPMEPNLPEVQMNLARPTEPVVGRIVSNELCMKGKSASFVRHVVIDLRDTPLAGHFHAGQSFGIIPPGVDEKGKPNKVRLYSVASPSWGEAGDGGVIATTPKRLIEELHYKGTPEEQQHRLRLGVASNYLCDCAVGDEVKVSGPSGKRFLLPVDRNAHDYIFIATGTGIAPYRGMAMELFDHPDGPTDRQVHLMMGAPYNSDLLYDDYFSDLADRFQNFHYHTAISRERRPDGRRGLYVPQLIEEQLDSLRDLLAAPTTLMYICGLIGVQVGVFQVLASADLGDGYLTIKDEYAAVAPASWDAAGVRRHVRPTHRCMVEVY